MQQFINDIKNKKICVLGMGISNLPLIKFLHEKGAGYIKVLDKNESEQTYKNVEMLSKDGVNFEYMFGDKYLEGLNEKFDFIFKTPIVRYDIPELIKASKQGTVITSEMELFLKLCKAKVYGITGSDGKTTTTTIIHKLLSFSISNGNKAWVGGNIGTPLLEYVDQISENDKVIVELSSFQLLNMSVSPDVSIVTNITPNHLDVHKSYDEYIEAKKNIFLNGNSLLVLNYDNEITRSFANQAPGEVMFFSSSVIPDYGCGIKDGYIVFNSHGVITKILETKDIKILGKHNIENYMAAICATFYDVNSDIVNKVAKEFKGVQHRMEFVRELSGVKYYNSSIDSSPNRTINALSVFDKKVVLIAGGKDKNIPYDELGPSLVDKVRVLILTGPTAAKIEQSALDEYNRRNEKPSIKIIHCTDYKEAVNAAKSEAVFGECVILSPASTSFDMFHNFEERGNIYKKYVNQL